MCVLMRRCKEELDSFKKGIEKRGTSKEATNHKNNMVRFKDRGLGAQAE